MRRRHARVDDTARWLGSLSVPLDGTGERPDIEIYDAADRAFDLLDLPLIAPACAEPTSAPEPSPRSRSW